MTTKSLDEQVMAKLRPPFGCKLVRGTPSRSIFGDVPPIPHWRIYDANDDAIASVSGLEEGYARLIVEALNAHPRFAK